ncbi:MAG: hypothetical protein HYY06_21925, partial [Deltaproteobacteria bacterium]|nr:hypothetical protein [Deltaproteobacteria bacterium]
APPAPRLVPPPPAPPPPVVAPAIAGPAAPPMPRPSTGPGAGHAHPQAGAPAAAGGGVKATMIGMPQQSSSPRPPIDDEEAATIISKVPDEIFSGAGGDGPSEEEHFRQIFGEFVDTKKRCGEPVESLTFDKFLVTLRKNKDTLVQRYQCKTVRFQVYVKEGKAALRATPVKG